MNLISAKVRKRKIKHLWKASSDFHEIGNSDFSEDWGGVVTGDEATIAEFKVDKASVRKDFDSIVIDGRPAKDSELINPFDSSSLRSSDGKSYVGSTNSKLYYSSGNTADYTYGTLSEKKILRSAKDFKYR